MKKFTVVVAVAAALFLSPLALAKEAKAPLDCPHKAAGKPCAMHQKHTDAKSCSKHKAEMSQHGEHHGQHKGKECNCSHRAMHQGKHDDVKACPHKGKGVAHHGEQKHTQVDTHNCPMHPKITGQKGDSCPKCGMWLEPQKGVNRDAMASKDHLGHQ